MFAVNKQVKLSELDLDTTYVQTRRSKGIIVGRHTGSVIKDNLGKVRVEIDDLTRGSIWLCPSNLKPTQPVHDPAFWQDMQTRVVDNFEDIICLNEDKSGLMVMPTMFKYCNSDHVLRFNSLLEIWFAMQFERLGIFWEHESRKFDLGPELFVPDFYLPDFDQYMELTTSKRSEKNKKIRGMIKNFPEITLVCIGRGKITEFAQALQKAATQQDVCDWLTGLGEHWADRVRRAQQ